MGFFYSMYKIDFFSEKKLSCLTFVCLLMFCQPSCHIMDFSCAAGSFHCSCKFVNSLTMIICSFFAFALNSLICKSAKDECFE